VTDHTPSRKSSSPCARAELAKRRGIWKGDPAEVLPSDSHRSTSRANRFLTYDELEALLGELLEDAAARVAFTIATSAEAAATERALREGRLARPPLRPGAGFEARDPLAQGADCGELQRELLIRA